jgi:hypothetical protein
MRDALYMTMKHETATKGETKMKNLNGRVVEIRGEDASCPFCGRRVGRPHVHLGTLYRVSR